jgi:hypothetical protein
MSESNHHPAKPWYQSTTIAGAIVTGVTALCAVFRLEIGDLSGDLTTGLLGLGAFVGTVMTIIGRFRARAALK